MTAERLFAWSAAVVTVILLWVGVARPVPTPVDRFVVIGLAAVVVLPLALVYLGWLSSFRSRLRGWR